MRLNKFFVLAGLVIASTLFSEGTARADEMNQSTKITFSAPVEIPGQVLPAGTYLFKLADSNNMNLIRVFNVDGTRLYATLETVSAERMTSNGNTVITLADPADGRPAALVKWFYPGRTTGHEFIYSKQESQQLAQSWLKTIAITEPAQAGD